MFVWMKSPRRIDRAIDVRLRGEIDHREELMLLEQRVHLSRDRQMSAL